MKVSIIIPARYGSSRYKGKPLILINKVPLVVRVVKNCIKALSSKDVFVATDNTIIAKTVKSYGYNYIMTSKKNLTGTDRVAEASKKINAKIIINVQGDEPLINPNDIKKVIKYKKKYKNHIICAYCEIRKDENVDRRTLPKVVFNERNELIYISRNRIPISKNSNHKIKFYKQVCIYAYTKQELSKFKKFNRKSKIEKIEDIEILRFFELGKKIKMVKVSNLSVAVDEPYDKRKVEKILNDKKKKK